MSKAEQDWLGLWKACKKNDVKKVQKLLKNDKNHKIDVNLSPERTGLKTCLFKSVQNKNFDIVKVLLEHPNIDPNKEWDTPLHQACGDKNGKMVKIFLEHPKIDPNLGGKNNSNLYVCNRKKFPEGFKMLLDHPKIKVDDNEAGRFKGECLQLYKEFEENGGAQSEEVIEKVEEKKVEVIEEVSSNDMFQTVIQMSKQVVKPVVKKDKIKYTKTKKLGAGAFGNVFKGILSDGTIVAIKEISLQTLGKEKADILRNFIDREVALLTNLDHKNIIKYIGSEETNEMVIIITEYASEGTILQFFNEADNTSDKVNLAKIYFKQVLTGLNYVHEKGIFHRDIKPDNILISQNNAKIADFGIAKEVGDDNTHYTNVGTRQFMSPDYLHYLANVEFGMDSKIDFSKIDIWALGVTFLFIITAKYPNLKDLYDGNKSVKVPTEVTDKNLRDLIEKMIAFKPQDRVTSKKLLDHPFFK